MTKPGSPGSAMSLTSARFGRRRTSRYCHRAAIASDVPGCREVVLHEQTGLLFPVDDAPALAEAMSQLAENREARTRYSTAARELVVGKFAAEIIGHQTVRLYRELRESGGCTMFNSQ